MRCGATLFGSHHRHLFPPIWQHLVGFGFRVQRVGSTMQNLRRVGENSDPILSRLWTKVHKIIRRCRKPLVLSNALFRLSVSRFIQKIFTIKSQSRRKTEQIGYKLFGPNFCRMDDSDFSTNLLGRLTSYYPLLGKVCLRSICWTPSTKPGNKRNANLHSGQNAGRVWSHLWTKVHDILGRYKRHLVVVNALDRLSIQSFLPKI